MNHEHKWKESQLLYSMKFCPECETWLYQDKLYDKTSLAEMINNLPYTS
jgi:hypothetical protein